MDIDATRAELIRVLGTATTAADASPCIEAGRAFLIDRGVAAIGIAPASALSLDDVLRIAASAPRTAARRDFAVFLLHALAIEGLVPARRGTERLIQSFLESALLNPLRRAGYPFDGTPYEKRQILARLHRRSTSIFARWSPRFRDGSPVRPATIRTSRDAGCGAQKAVRHTGAV